METKQKDQCTPLHIACQNGHLQIVQYLIEKGDNIEAKDKDKYTPLQCASNFDLIEKGDNIEAKDKDKYTPLQCASNFGNNDVVKYIISKKKTNKNVKDKSGKRPYDVACDWIQYKSQIDYQRTPQKHEVDKDYLIEQK